MKKEPHRFYRMNSIGKVNKVSIVLPLYNAENTIVFSVRSVVDQTYKDWELIIVNDGSTDNSVAVLLELLDQLDFETREKIKFLSQENKGPSFTRNLGITSATGSYIAFIDSDDAWVKEKLDLQMSYFEKNKNIGIIAGGFNNIIFPKDDKFIEISFTKLLFRNYFLTPTVVIKKDFLDGEDYYFNEDKKYSEDQDLWFRLTHKRKGMYINEILAKNIVGKANFGESGLSANLAAMHRGEIENYIFQYQQKNISIITLLVVIGFSYLKYYRRKWITKK